MLSKMDIFNIVLEVLRNTNNADFDENLEGVADSIMERLVEEGALDSSEENIDINDESWDIEENPKSNFMDDEEEMWEDD